jgi:predicted PurR-regulated permease PerM
MTGLPLTDVPVDASAPATEDRVVGSARRSFALGFVVVGVLVLYQLVVRLENTVGLVVLASVMALLTDPVRRAITRVLGRAAGYVLTALGTYGAITGTAALVWWGLDTESERLADVLTERVASLEPGSLPARVADVTDATGAIAAVFDRAPLTFVAGSDSAVSVGRLLVELFVAVILAAFLQASARSILDWAAGRWDRPHRAGMRAWVGDVLGRGAAVTRRSLLLAAVTAGAVGGTAAVLSTSGAVILGAWAGVWIVVPRVGALVGLAPLVAAGFAASPAVGLAAVGVAAAVAVAAHAARHRWIQSRLYVPGALWIVAYGAGSTVAGPGGAVVAIALLCLVAAALTSPFSLPPRRVVPTDGEPPVRRPWAATFERIDLPTLVGIGLGTAAVALVWVMIGELSPAFVWIVIAVMVTVALDRPIGWMTRRTRLGHTAAAAVVLGLLAVLLTGIVLLGVRGAVSSASDTGNLPEIVAELETVPVVGGWLADRDASVWVDAQLQDLPQRLSETAAVGTWLPTVGNRTVDLLWTVLLAVTLIFDGRRIADAVADRAPAHRRRQVVRLGSISVEAIAGYLAGAILVAAINATTVFTIAVVLGLGLAPVLAAWAFIWNFVPQIGGFMGGFPLVVLALGVGPMSAVLAGSLYLAYQLTENHVIQPKVIGEAIDVPAWATLLTALAGGAAAGLVGAVVLTPLVGVVHLALREYRRADFPGRTAATLDGRSDRDDPVPLGAGSG